MNEQKYRAYLPKYEKILYSDNQPDDDYLDIWDVNPNGVNVMIQETIDSNPEGMGHEQIDEYVTPEQYVTQCIGLKDKYEKEIYNGDILQEECARGNRYIVFPVPGGFAINTHQDDLNKPNIIFYDSTADMQTASYISGSCMIIGNKFEHPSLLNK